ncbi:polyamine oxidase [Aspergillus terreus]|uniref:Polyamine oxidase n=1 Tax=Aspergillus terreus TaxID=33178 RepID=A0A5M3YY72_ASPTE|nr:hypothetical protein ATETN484_0005044700 [Aspergillus terreus]GFF17112.1 polyamine oxidase [Aspergillus terreus]
MTANRRLSLDAIGLDNNPLRVSNPTSFSLLNDMVLRLGKNLQQDEQAQFCSKQALDTAQDVLDECKTVFKQISNAVEQSPDDSIERIRRAARRFGLALIERDLERVKSTTLLMLSVIMYAGQLRSCAETAILQDQRPLVQTLTEQKKTYDGMFDGLRYAIISGGVGDGLRATTGSGSKSPGIPGQWDGS